MIETWLPVAGYEGFYEVSDMGRVRSLPRIDSIGRKLSGKVLKQTASGRGRYLRVALWKNAETRTVTVHPLVLEAFVGPRPARWQCRHLNGDPHDNRLENLAWGTAVENRHDMLIHGNDHHVNKKVCPTCGGPFSTWKDGNRYCHPCKNRKRRKTIGD